MPEQPRSVESEHDPIASGRPRFPEGRPPAHLPPSDDLHREAHAMPGLYVQETGHGWELRSHTANGVLFGTLGDALTMACYPGEAVGVVVFLRSGRPGSGRRTLAAVSAEGWSVPSQRPQSGARHRRRTRSTGRRLRPCVRPLRQARRSVANMFSAADLAAPPFLLCLCQAPQSHWDSSIEVVRTRRNALTELLPALCNKYPRT